MTNLFDVVPESFFQLFSGANRRFYADVTFLLYEQFQLNRTGIQYSLMKDVIQELIETKEGYGEYVGVDLESEESNLDVAAKASRVLRRLKELKWIDVETRDQFEDYIVLPVYSSRILAVLKAVCDNKVIEYQRYCFVTYQLLTGEEAKLRPATAILESATYSESFYDELIILFNNMKHHMEKISLKTDIQQILEHHFGEYKKEIVDKSYHRLRTSDHVSRYRSKILERVQTWYLDSTFIERTVEDAMESGYFSSRPEAEERIHKALYVINDIYNNLDNIWDKIDARHYQYLRAVVERARYLSSFNESTEHKISYILENINQNRNGELTNLFRFLQLQQLQESSFASPRKRRSIHQPEQHPVSTIDEELRTKAKEENLQRIENVINRKKIKDFVLGAMKGREEMMMTDFELQNEQNALYLAYIYLYGHDGKSGYKLSTDFPRLERKNGYIFSNRTIRKHSDGGGK